MSTIEIHVPDIGDFKEVEVIELLASLGRRQPRFDRNTVDNFVGQTHERIHIVDMLAGSSGQDAGCQPEGRRVFTDDERCRAFGHTVVQGEAGHRFATNVRVFSNSTISG